MQHHILCWTWTHISSVWYYVNSTARISCICWYTTHVSATLRSICHSCWRQSLTLYRAQFFSRGQTLMLTFHHCSKIFVRELFHCHIWCVTSGQLTLRTRGHISKLFRKILARFPTSSNDEKFAASQLSNTWLYYRVWVISANKCQGLLFQD